MVQFQDGRVCVNQTDGALRRFEPLFAARRDFATFDLTPRLALISIAVQLAPLVAHQRFCRTHVARHRHVTPARGHAGAKLVKYPGIRRAAP